MLIAFNDFNALVTSILWNIDSESRIVVVVPKKMNIDVIVSAVAKDARGSVKIVNREDGIKLLNSIFIIPANLDGSKIRGLRPRSTWIYNKDQMKEEDWTTIAFGLAAVSKDPVSKVKRSLKRK